MKLIQAVVIIITFALCVQSASVPQQEGQEWAVLLAASSGYINYRHQADVCHAYQTLHAQGIPDERIIVMMVDDIAYHSNNPTKGKLINRPNGPDVYAGVPKDYIGSNVTAENFLAVLLGDEEKVRGAGSGKVLKSGPHDRVFINMVDLGGPGVFSFPRDVLHANDFINVLKQMHSNNTYKELVIYMESCNSGSMFSKLLPDNLNIYAVTATNPYSSSRAVYWDNLRNAFVGDLFSVTWMEDTDLKKRSETFGQQFNIVLHKVSYLQTECKYGNFSLQERTIWDFFGNKGIQKSSSDIPVKTQRHTDAVKSTDVPIYVLENQLKSAHSQQEKAVIEKKLFNLLKDRRYVRGVIEDIVIKISQSYNVMLDVMAQKIGHISDHKCYQSTLDQFHAHCFNLGQNPFATQLVGVFSHLCNRGFTYKQMASDIADTCKGVKNLNVQ